MKLRLRALLLFPILICGLQAEPTITPESAGFQKAITDLAEASQMNVGIAIKNLATGEEFLHNADDVFPQGSSIRIHIVAELYRQAAAKKVSVDEPRAFPESARTSGFGVLSHMGKGTVLMSLHDYAVLMIMVNDNSAANFLTDVLGMDAINASLAAQGTPEIKVQRKALPRQESQPTPDNVGTPRAVMRSLELLHQGEVVDRSTSDAILKVIALPEVSYFRRNLPPGIAFAGRSGSGPTSRCDTGIVMLKEQPYILCVMLKDIPQSPVGGPKFAKADALISRVTQLAQQFFSAKSASDAAKPANEPPPPPQATPSSSSGKTTPASS